MQTALYGLPSAGVRAGLGLREPGPVELLGSFVGRIRRQTVGLMFWQRNEASDRPVAKQLDRRIAAIEAYAQFLEDNPDMPAAHRQRFTARILACRRDLRDRAGRQSR